MEISKIIYSFHRKLLPSMEKVFNNNLTAEDDEEEDDDATLAEMVTNVPGGQCVDERNIVDWLNTDANDPGFEHLTDEIVNRVRGTEANDEALGEEEEEPTTENWITHDEALKHVSCLLNYLEQDSHVLLADKLVFWKIKSQIKKEELFRRLVGRNTLKQEVRSCI
ncbi:hypothetical protein QYM36_010291 [Artemia franciscana]|uniref:Uncharacterized protein n=1 Tax=Artemia franciscana TaxID=6661 RepID=A0AA88L1M4_ARTSF|nr:hypothetical protein QYM36_010291 [Artemia franciscana]